MLPPGERVERLYQSNNKEKMYGLPSSLLGKFSGGQSLELTRQHSTHWQ